MKRVTKNLMKTLVLSFVLLAAPLSVFADTGQTVVNGDIQATVLDFTVPSSTSFTIDPNANTPEEQFIAPDFTISNGTLAPLSISVSSFDVAAGSEVSFTNVLPADMDWDNLNKVESSQYLALGLKAVDSSVWNTFDLTGPLYAKDVEINGETTIGSIASESSVDFTFVANHGKSFEAQKTVSYDVVFEFSLH